LPARKPARTIGSIDRAGLTPPHCQPSARMIRPERIAHGYLIDFNNQLDDSD
jgi:hypothetical protein